MSSIGMDARTGRWLRNGAHIEQSLNDIMRTRVGSVVLARDYGSDVPSRVDAPMNARNVLGLYSDIHGALTARKGMYGELGEPRFEVRSIKIVNSSTSGSITLALVGVSYPNGHKGDRTVSTEQSFTAYITKLAETP